MKSHPVRDHSELYEGPQLMGHIRDFRLNSLNETGAVRFRDPAISTAIMPGKCYRQSVLQKL